MAMTVRDLANLSHNGQVYRSFGMALAANYGLLAMMSLPDVDGPLIGLIDGCPVVWQEAFAVLSHHADEPISPHLPRLNAQTIDLLAQYSELDALPYEWRCGLMDDYGTFVFVHHSGLRIAMDPYRALTPHAYAQKT